MDRQTRELRRRNKAVSGKRGELPQFGSRGLGRKLKSAETFPLQQCGFIEGGERLLIFKRRKDKTSYAIPLILGGTRCSETALTGGRCLKHIGERDD